MSIKFILLLTYILLNVSCLTPGVDFPKKNGVLYLTDYTYEEACKEYEYVLISAFSEICGTCTGKIAPGFEKLYKILDEDEPELKGRIGIGKIVGYYNDYFMDKFEIMGYPTVLLFKDGEKVAEVPHRYSIEDLLIFLRKHILKPVQLIKDMKHFQLLVNDTRNEGFVTYYGKNPEVIKSMGEISKEFRFLTFVNVQDQGLIKELEVNFEQLSINKNMDEKQIIENPPKDEIWTINNIRKFIKKYNHKVLFQFQSYEGKYLIKNRNDTLLLVVKEEEEQKDKKFGHSKISKEKKQFYDSFYTLAKGVRDIIQSAKIDYKEELAKKKKKKEPKKPKVIGDPDDLFGFKARKKEEDEIERKQNVFTSKLGLNKTLECEIKLLNIDRSLEEPVYYTLPCGEEKIKENINFIKNWYNKKLPNNTVVGNIDTDDLIIDDEEE